MVSSHGPEIIRCQGPPRQQVVGLDYSIATKRPATLDGNLVRGEARGHWSNGSLSAQR